MSQENRNKKVFAIGLGCYYDPTIRYNKAFLHTEENDIAVTDFLEIISSFFGYKQGDGNVVLKIKDIKDNLDEFKVSLIKKKHSGSAYFLEMIERDNLQDDAFICIIEENKAHKSKEEMFLILKLLSDEKITHISYHFRIKMRDFRDSSGKHYGEYLKSLVGIMDKPNTIIILHKKYYCVGVIELLANEFAIDDDDPINRYNWEHPDKAIFFR